MSGHILKKLRNKVVKEVEKECKDLINVTIILVNTTMLRFLTPTLQNC